MAGLTALGIIFEGIGLTLLALSLAKTWREVGKGYLLSTGEPKGPRVLQASATISAHSHAYGTVGKVGETRDDVLADMRKELRAMQQRLDAVGDARADGDAELKRVIQEVVREEDERERAAQRADIREGIFGLYWALGGLVLQLLGALLGL